MLKSQIVSWNLSLELITFLILHETQFVNQLPDTLQSIQVELFIVLIQLVTRCQASLNIDFFVPQFFKVQCLSVELLMTDYKICTTSGTKSKIDTSKHATGSVVAQETTKLCKDRASAVWDHLC